MHTGYRQFYIHEKSESFRIKIQRYLEREKKKEKKNDDEREKESIKVRTEVL
jgi:hypothetical protein